MAANDSSWRVVDRMGCAVDTTVRRKGHRRRHLVSGVPGAYPATLVMVERRRYRKCPDRAVIAVQIDLDTPGFTYRKWGGEQRCKAGDWLVDNDGDVYTVDRESFAHLPAGRAGAVAEDVGRLGGGRDRCRHPVDQGGRHALRAGRLSRSSTSRTAAIHTPSRGTSSRSLRTGRVNRPARASHRRQVEPPRPPGRLA